MVRRTLLAASRCSVIAAFEPHPDPDDPRAFLRVPRHILVLALTLLSGCQQDCGHGWPHPDASAYLPCELELHDGGALTVARGHTFECCPGGAEAAVELPDGSGMLCTGAEPFGAPLVLGGCGGFNVCNSSEFVCSSSLLPGVHPCLNLPACRYLRDALQQPVSGTCFYDDLSDAVTGVIPSVTCTSALEAATLCGIGCPCLDGSSCFGVSEQHPIGVCAPFIIESCRSTSECTNGRVCIVPHATPPWLDASWFRPDGMGSFFQLHGPVGRCVSASGCQAIDQQYPNTWECRP